MTDHEIRADFWKIYDKVYQARRNHRIECETCENSDVCAEWRRYHDILNDIDKIVDKL